MQFQGFSYSCTCIWLIFRDWAFASPRTHGTTDTACQYSIHDWIHSIETPFSHNSVSITASHASVSTWYGRVANNPFGRSDKQLYNVCPRLPLCRCYKRIQFYSQRMHSSEYHFIVSLDYSWHFTSWWNTAPWSASLVRACGCKIWLATASHSSTLSCESRDPTTYQWPSRSSNIYCHGETVCPSSGVPRSSSRPSRVSICRKPIARLPRWWTIFRYRSRVDQHNTITSDVLHTRGPTRTFVL